MKVRRVDYIPHATHSRISPLQFKISGLSPEATLRTVAYVAGVLLGVPSSSEGSDHAGTRDPTVDGGFIETALPTSEVLASAFVCDGEGAVVTQASARWREHCASRRCQRTMPRKQLAPPQNATNYIKTAALESSAASHRCSENTELKVSNCKFHVKFSGIV